jgi:geranylgeranyl diphosphate synthase type I
MDEDDVRRNKPTIHKLMKDDFLKKFEDKPARLFNTLSTRHAVTEAMCSGNILYSLGTVVLLESNAEPLLVKKALQFYSDAFNIVNDGQILDTKFELISPTEEQYLKMIEFKTANLFKASVEIGAILGNASENQLEALSRYATDAAIAFQLQDDLLDLTTAKGNTFGSDIKNGKRTLILIKALESATAEQKQLINQVLGNESATLEQIEQVISIFNETGAIDYVNQLAKQKIEQAKAYLNNAELEQKPKEFFLQLADFMVNRQN